GPGGSSPHPSPPPSPPPNGVPLPSPAAPPGAPLHRYDPWAAPGSPHTPPMPPAAGSAPPYTGAPTDPAEGEPARPVRRRLRLLTGALLLALVSGGVGGLVGAELERSGGPVQVRLPQVAEGERTTDPGTIAGIAETALPGVVTLYVRGNGNAGTGTGFVLDDRGHILTNAHVVGPAGGSGRIQVTFNSGDTVDAVQVGADSGYDLAVVRVDGVSGLSPLPLGDSDGVRVGDAVVAIGSPFDLDGTVTAGIISAVNRPITAGGDGDGTDVSYVNALQTDAAINPGNSGGPLVDTGGRVIGINSAIRTPELGFGPDGESRGGSVGLGFAIPVNQAHRVAEELINTGRATHPVIGVMVDMGFDGIGARVASRSDDPAVVPGGPGDLAGLEEGDIITAVDGERVRSGDELIVRVRSHRPGDVLEITVERGGGELVFPVTLGAAGGD
ncbi:S1C family serine protease, partial [Streptomyces sp. ST2-7A]|uniref:S1C family serine protease n=1 Tax=Streptomyces sp. ST2-7A TaxID=2907214 RepID=UPI001F21DEBB